MIKGIQRKMVLIRTPDSKIFEEAHFVLRTDGASCPSRQGEMLNEANRIIEAARIGIDPAKHGARKMGIKGLLGFLFGGLLGSGIVGGVWLLISFL